MLNLGVICAVTCHSPQGYQHVLATCVLRLPAVLPEYRNLIFKMILNKKKKNQSDSMTVVPFCLCTSYKSFFNVEFMNYLRKYASNHLKERVTSSQATF